MASTINTESMVESVINRLLNELYISGLDKITILRVFPIKPIMSDSGGLFHNIQRKQIFCTFANFFYSRRISIVWKCKYKISTNARHEKKRVFLYALIIFSHHRDIIPLNTHLNWLYAYLIKNMSLLLSRDCMMCKIKQSYPLHGTCLFQNKSLFYMNDAIFHIFFTDFLCKQKRCMMMINVTK